MTIINQEGLIVRLFKYCGPMASVLVISGCMNMPTKPSQITASYVSPMEYSGYTCDKLVAELGSLSRRESQLAIAQEQRYKTSEMQAFWLGYGQGDGIEASELANVKGRKEAVLTEIKISKCENLDAATQSNN
ncbi:MAG: hypothetical protein LBP52_06965 [Burkholderiaceae bacterium]|nr:hypothetical protein [Burkholderiaceae bacterium]